MELFQNNSTGNKFRELIMIIKFSTFRYFIYEITGNFPSQRMEKMHERA